MSATAKASTEGAIMDIPYSMLRRAHLNGETRRAINVAPCQRFAGLSAGHIKTQRSAAARVREIAATGVIHSRVAAYRNASSGRAVFCMLQAVPRRNRRSRS